MYEYVSRREYRYPRTQFENLIHLVQKRLNRGYDFKHNAARKYTFSYHLIGSGRTKLITRRKGASEAIDFDYNLELQKYDKKQNCETIRKDIFKAFSDVCREYSKMDQDAIKYNVKESKRVITVVARMENTIIFSADFAILKLLSTQMHVIVFDGSDSTYKWNTVREFNETEQKLRIIRERKLYGLVKGKYLYLKSRNRDTEKKSYNIYLEAINNVYAENIR